MPPGPIDCDLHPTVPGMSALMPYLDEVWRETVVRRGIDELNTIAYPSNSPLTVRSDWRDAKGRASHHGRTVRHRGAGSVRHRDRHLQLPLRRAGDVQRGPWRRHGARGERLDRARVAGPRLQAARLDRGAAAERRTGGGGDRALRRRPAVRPGHASGIGGVAAGAAAELADLCRRGAPRPARRHPCRQHLSPSEHAGRLVQLLQRGIHQPGGRVSDPAHQPDRPRACSPNSRT